jgi:ectoine hydroxylase-related dioxygenase (phytanoyl-CoA dioxygenase family)
VAPPALDDFLFDLRGFLVIPRAVSQDLVTRLNDAFDRIPSLEPGEWVGNAQRRDYGSFTGLELHNCLEFDPAFHELIDHPGWLGHALHYAGERQSYVQGLFIDECIASARGPGGHHPVHSGAYHAAVRTQYRFEHGVFRCGQLNVIVALNDIGEDDGPTMVVPGSHKSNFQHPLAGDYMQGDRMDTLPGAEPVLMQTGDALLFVDSLMHGAASRTRADGERRVVILRYGPTWARTRFGYTYSPELLDQLTPERREILEPVPPVHPGDPTIPLEAPRLRAMRLTQAATSI